MEKIILILISIAVIFTVGCSTDEPTYLAEVVYLKTPEIITINDKELLRVEFAVADLKNRTGDVTIFVDGEETILKNRYFSPEGSVIVADIDKKVTERVNLKFKVEAGSDTSTVTFSNLKLNTSSKSGNFTLDIVISNIKDDIGEKINAKLKFSNMFNKENKDGIFLPENGKITLRGLTPKRYSFRVDENEGLEHGFYRSVELNSILLDKTTKIYINLIYASNQYYDEPLISCNYNGAINQIAYLLFLLFFIFSIRKISKKN